MPEPKILFNSSSGSDTQASGAGPATAVFGTGASLNATTSVNLSADNPDLSGVATDGSACLWVSTASGRQFAKITAVNNTTKIVTVAIAYGVTATGQTWAIGGKRATLDNVNSRTLFSAGSYAAFSTGWQSGWEALIETDQTLNSTLIVSGPGAGIAVFRSNAAGSLRTITCTADQPVLGWVSSGWTNTFEFRDIKIQSSSVTKTATDGIAVAGGGSNRSLMLRRCVIGDPANTLRQGVNYAVSLIDCTIQNCSGIAMPEMNAPVNIYGCVFKNNTGSPVLRFNGATWSVARCLFHNNSGDCILMNHNQIAGTAFVTDCTFDESGSSALSNLLGSGGVNGYQVINCNMTKSASIGMRGFLISELPNSSATNCNFGSGVDANTGGATNGAVLEYNNLAVNGTYVNRATKDYTPAAGIKAKGMPLPPSTLGNNQAVPLSYIDIGAIQSAGGGGGSIFFRPGMSGGMNE